MIMLVPYSPEVPRNQAPKLWQALVMVLILGACYQSIRGVLERDKEYVEGMQDMIEIDEEGQTVLTPEAHDYLKQRPLLKIAPSKGNWSVQRLFLANFLHGSLSHLALNLVGVFAGFRICSTFLPFWSTLIIYLLGGSFGLFLSTKYSMDVSPFIPHVGSSAGIFALMGTYYVFNFRFRTRYFFWFPSRRLATIPLKTSWFFFVDVILLEIILTSAQLFPNRLGNVDHLAHVVGWISGCGLAVFIRILMRWPSFLQTRSEFRFWRKNEIRMVLPDLEGCLKLLDLNPYNDFLKILLCSHLESRKAPLSEGELKRAFKRLSPTFIRLHTVPVAKVLLTYLEKGVKIPDEWYRRIPFDSVIRIAKEMTHTANTQNLLLRLVLEYRKLHPEAGSLDRKLELLTAKLKAVVPVSSDSGGGVQGTGT